MRQAGAPFHRGTRASNYRGLSLWSTGSRCACSFVVAHGPSCSVACGIFPDQCSNPFPLHWQADSQALPHQGSPGLAFKAHERRQYFDNDAVGQKGHMRFFLNIFRKKRIRPFWPAKQVDDAYQHSTEVSLPISQKDLPGKV